MCFRPPTVDFNDSKCPKCGHENFIGVTKCAQCGALLEAGPVGTASAESRDWTPGLDFKEQGAFRAPQVPAPKAPGSLKPSSAPGVPR